MYKHSDRKRIYLRNLINNKESDNWNPLQREALFPREVLQPLYEKWKSKYATSNSAEEFFGFLLRQPK